MRRVRLEDGPKFEAIHRRVAEQNNSFNDLGPIIRFLKKNLGRPWDKVYSEICATNDLRNVAQKHLRHHIFDFVTLHVEIRDGVVIDREHYCGQPLGRWRRSFYVCPKSGLLKHVQPCRKPPGIGGRICNTRELQFHRIGGTWYEVVLRPIPPQKTK